LFILIKLGDTLPSWPGSELLNQKRWLITSGIILALAFCCNLAICGLAGFLVSQRSAESASYNQSLPPPPQEQDPIPELVQRPPQSVERQAASLVTQSILPKRDLMDLAHRLQGLPRSTPRVSLNGPENHELGDTEIFWIHNAQDNTFFTATANLSYETPHAYWWIEEGYEVPTESLEQSAQNFENNTYPTSHRFFGSEWSPGVDGDPHVYIFLGNVPGVGGYFSGPDEYPIQIRPRSNEHEMFYVNLDNATPGTDYFDGLLAHEFQHMIHWAMDQDEDTWVNEGLSELASQVTGYDVGGSDILFSSAPDTQLTTWPELGDSAPHYGASYLFLAYFMDQYGEEAVNKLVAEPANGVAGFNAVLADVDPTGRRFADLFADWVIANYLDEPQLAKGRYGYADLLPHQPVHSTEHSTYPARGQATVAQYGADYILLESGADLTIEFTGTTVVPLVGNEVHSGDYQWWAKRGDEGDATLTRAFDLSSLEQATLQAWMWYNLETDYDYAYVEVSADSGKTWDILASEYTTTANPSGNSYGAALTGISGGGDEPHWIQQVFDLTPYAGQPVLIRFEVVTDEAVNHPGLCLDDITIPELGYLDDAEGGDDGWQAQGWLRITDHIPQEYVVQLITIGQEVRVERMDLNEQSQGKMTVSGLGHDITHQAVLVISALAPATTEQAPYSYRITEE
jgi:immune inhibitor A